MTKAHSYRSCARFFYKMFLVTTIWVVQSHERNPDPYILVVSTATGCCRTNLGWESSCWGGCKIEAPIHHLEQTWGAEIWYSWRVMEGLRKYTFHKKTKVAGISLYYNKPIFSLKNKVAGLNHFIINPIYILYFSVPCMLHPTGRSFNHGNGPAILPQEVVVTLKSLSL